MLKQIPVNLSKGASTRNFSLMQWILGVKGVGVEVWVNLLIENL